MNRPAAPSADRSGAADLSTSRGFGDSPENDQSEGSSDRLLKAREIQRELGVSRATAYRMMADGTLPIYRFGGRGGQRAMIRVSLRDLRAWIAAHRTLSSASGQVPTC
jgi:excisionase family DNA binding protein